MIATGPGNAVAITAPQSALTLTLQCHSLAKTGTTVQLSLKVTIGSDVYLITADTDDTAALSRLILHALILQFDFTFHILTQDSQATLETACIRRWL